MTSRVNPKSPFSLSLSCGFEETPRPGHLIDIGGGKRSLEYHNTQYENLTPPC
jgi:hypothetical protein